MPCCPKCKTEFVNEVFRCPDCGGSLVETLPEEKAPVQASAVEMERFPEDGEWAFLTTAGDTVEADILESLLSSFGVPVVRKYREAGAYLKIYMGNTYYGVDIFVPSKALDAAKDIIKPQENFPDEEMD